MISSYINIISIL